MKNTYIYIVMVLMLIISSCDNEEFLKVDHYSILDADQMFKTDEDAKAGLIGCYDMMLPNAETNGDWGFKPNLFIGGHPTMDTQATGWDKDWNTQNWNPGSPELLSGWKHAYKAISRCNDFLAGLEATDNISADLKVTLEGEARSVRAFFYMWLAKAFGRVPMLETGETYISTPAKARAETYNEMWDFIIADLEAAKDLLEWEPLDGQYGRCTKGFALSYLGEAYMWKAFRSPEDATAMYTAAKDVLLQVINSGRYEMNPSFTTLWDPGAVWTKECIWEQVLDEGSQWNSWSNLTDAHNWMTYFTAAPATGGWGSLYLSWEWWSSYENGDKRRDASGVTGPINDIEADWKSETNYGYNPYVQQSIEGDLSSHYHYYKEGEAAPAIWCLKYWRTCRADWSAMWGPQQVYYKRYTNVLFDYAECLFNLNGEGDAEAWAIIEDIRDRAFGNLEVGKKDELTTKFLPYYQQLAQYYSEEVPTEYPLPFNEAVVDVPDAKDYYTQLKSEKGFSSPVWLVALGMERRKEFNAEWCLAQDLFRSGFIEDHISNNYPQGVGYPNTDPLVQDAWQTYRTFDFDLLKMDMPIPSDEIIKNPLCDQNEAYQ